LVSKGWTPGVKVSKWGRVDTRASRYTGTGVKEPKHTEVGVMEDKRVTARVEENLHGRFRKVLLREGRTAQWFLNMMIEKYVEKKEGREHTDPASPDDLRDLGWAVAVHNDYRLDGQNHTFWLMTRGGQAVKGEGRTDSEALDAIRKQIDTSTGNLREVESD